MVTTPLTAAKPSVQAEKKEPKKKTIKEVQKPNPEPVKPSFPSNEEE